MVTCATLPPLVSAVSLARLAAFIGRTPRHPPSPPPDDRDVDAWVARTLRALPPPWRYSCLRRGVVMYHLLRRAGRPVGLRIGVRRGSSEGGPLEAHAWLVLDDVPYLEPEAHEARAFQVIAAFPEPQRG